MAYGPNCTSTFFPNMVILGICYDADVFSSLSFWEFGFKELFDAIQKHWNLITTTKRSKTEYFGSPHNQHKMAALVSGIFGFIFIQSESMETCLTTLFISKVLKKKHKLPNKLLCSLWQATTELKPSWGNKAKLQGIMGVRGQMLMCDDQRFAVLGELTVNWQLYSPCVQGGELYGRQISFLIPLPSQVINGRPDCTPSLCPAPLQPINRHPSLLLLKRRS